MHSPAIPRPVLEPVETIMPETAQIALITAHGQPSNPRPPEAALASLARQVQRQLPSWDIRSATLSTPGRLESELSEGAVIYPFFMAQGWFAGRVLPQRLGNVQHQMACPFGLDPALPALVAAAVIQHVNQRDWGDQDYDLLLAAHGSARGAKAAEATNSFAAALRPLLPSARITTGFIEQSPHVETAAQSLGSDALCLPFFAQSGDHSRNDIPKALTTANFTGTRLPTAGTLPDVPTLIAQAIAACRSFPAGAA